MNDLDSLDCRIVGCGPAGRPIGDSRPRALLIEAGGTSAMPAIPTDGARAAVTIMEGKASGMILAATRA